MGQLCKQLGAGDDGDVDPLGVMWRVQTMQTFRCKVLATGLGSPQILDPTPLKSNISIAKQGQIARRATPSLTL